jgi:hypothetical protein
MGDLLFKIAGINKSSADMDDQIESASADSAKRVLVERLGMERYYSILSSLYIIRSDAHGIVQVSLIFQALSDKRVCKSGNLLFPILLERSRIFFRL